MPKGFVHGDLIPDNCLFEQGKLAAVLDFEESCLYPFVFDLGMCAAGNCARDGALSLELYQSLLAGYQQVRPLEVVEKEQLQLYTEYAAISNTFWHFRQYRIRAPEADRHDSYRVIKQLAEHIRGISSKTFRETLGIEE